MQQYLIDRNVEIPMRDGVRLFADIYRPNHDKPIPAILSRTPYGKDNKHSPNMHSFAIDALRAAEAGFAVIFQDVRGRYASEGVFTPYLQEGNDGFDTIAWLAEQPWCNGAVGMTGGSYLGAVQWLAAAQHPLALKAICPSITGSDYYDGWTYQGGAFNQGIILLWVLGILMPDAIVRESNSKDLLDEIIDLVDRMPEVYAGQHNARIWQLAEQLAPYLQTWLSHTSRDEYWQSVAFDRSKIDLPVLNIGGWFDIFSMGTVDNHSQAEDQYLLMGPWAHGDTSGSYHDAFCGALSSWESADITGLQIDFFDRYLNENPLAFQAASAKLFLMGENRWVEKDGFPASTATWYLAPDGKLESSPPTSDSSSKSSYYYDPSDPTPTIGGQTFLPGLGISANAGLLDHRPNEARPDVLVYTSPVLEQPLCVLGSIKLVLFAATDAKDIDFVVTLCDVTPEGKSLVLAQNVQRASFIHSLEKPSLLEPNTINRYEIRVGVTGNTFQQGHQIRLCIASASHPRFAPNPYVTQLATQIVYHNEKYPSCLILSVEGSV